MPPTPLVRHGAHVRIRFVALALFCLLLSACGGGGGGGGDDADGALAIQPVQIPGGTAGAVYAATLFGSGGSGAGYTWDLVQGTLPPGVAGLPATSATARLAGNPGAAGTYTFTVRLRDSNDAAATQQYTVTIDSAGGPGPGSDFETNLAGAPGGRTGHTAVWTGTEMIVWGGYQMTGLLNSGGAYDPLTDTWRTITSNGAPSARSDHTAVWTGTEMIVWGGWDNLGFVGSGGAYDPVQNTWRTLPAGGAPQARSSHTAVWTGGVMVVWGGQGQFPPPAPNSVDLVFGDGAAYDPALDQWAAIAQGGPAARGHKAVWTGSQMITWGGRDSFALSLSTLNLGGRYDPVQDTWSSTDVGAAPAARVDHTAVWSGATGMVVWGGTTNGLTLLDSGGRYQPTTNGWQTTQLLGPPTPRTGHTAIWTGTEMVVWGGAAAGTVLADGAAYDPAGNTWRALTNTLNVDARTGHTAVWTGSAMVLWGGQGTPADAYHSSGAVIQP